ncbi:hypothetical protein SAMN05518845_11951 [Variovorax sp. YR750]|nr:hypothetical protein [Variovorax paradoxus]SEF19538.1 hypothetical protein SAMN03159371_00182 [Variovorax sp. NFACC28]SEF70074.1 hypothetical protein SAMN03159365_00636 [Variovorax sp. NFACC29]SEM25939.1 hypothetical protein SAMN05518845_11951 [Variovorax sp. YR750]SFB76292.1 hypothetical protein SAMN03159379_00635 [Variovorax sp. NFACC26]SFG75984.1 hypothetical protein SAMN03159447_04757 [Variovorax sp. NFACC27]
MQTGLSRTGVFDICKRHEAAGVKALRDAPGGRKLGDGRRLDAAQEAAARKLLTDKTPDQLKMAYALWTRVALVNSSSNALAYDFRCARWVFTWRAGASHLRSP